jgi:uncharacterized protein YndB with AHSA1/START domain
MDIDTTAPLHARQEILIAAPVEKVWNLQTDIDRWHEWQPDVQSAKLDGKLAAGTTFRWKAMGLGITSQLHTVEPPRRVGWTGDSLGMHAIHNWTFEPHVDGTRVVTEESLSGWMPRLLKLFDAKFLEKSLEKSLKTLKAAAERA